MVSVHDLRPYHITWAENLERILSIRAILSMRELDRRKIKYSRPGCYDRERVGKKPLFYGFSHQEEIKYRCDIVEIDLNEYVPFYLFSGENLVPPFVWRMLKECLNGTKDGVIFFLKPLKDLPLSEIKHLICYGPGAGHGILFKSLDDFCKYIEIPTPDPMKPALQSLLRSGANPYSDYHKKIIESEFLIREGVPIQFVDKVMFIGKMNSFRELYLPMLNEKGLLDRIPDFSTIDGEAICVVLPDSEIFEAREKQVIREIHYLNWNKIVYIF